MIPSLHDDQILAAYGVDEPVLISDPPGPVATEVLGQTLSRRSNSPASTWATLSISRLAFAGDLSRYRVSAIDFRADE